MAFEADPSRRQLAALKEAAEDQRALNKVNAELYQIGYANGLILALALMENATPRFIAVPEELRRRVYGPPCFCQRGGWRMKGTGPHDA